VVQGCLPSLNGGEDITLEGDCLQHGFGLSHREGVLEGKVHEQAFSFFGLLPAHPH